MKLDKRRIQTTPSKSPEAKYSPSEENATCITLAPCSVNTAAHEPSATLHSCNPVPWHVAVATYLLSGENLVRTEWIFHL